MVKNKKNTGEHLEVETQKPQVQSTWWQTDPWVLSQLCIINEHQAPIGHTISILDSFITASYTVETLSRWQDLSTNTNFCGSSLYSHCIKSTFCNDYITFNNTTIHAVAESNKTLVPSDKSSGIVHSSATDGQNHYSFITREQPQSFPLRQNVFRCGGKTKQFITTWEANL